MTFSHPVTLTPEEAESVVTALRAAHSQMYADARKTKQSSTREYALRQGDVYRDLADSLTRRASQFGTPDVVALFRKYGEHDDRCDSYDDTNKPRRPCSCGFAEAWYTVFPESRP